MTPVALRISSSSGLPLPPAKAAPCVLDLLDHGRPAHARRNQSARLRRMAAVEVDGIEGLKELIGQEDRARRVARGHPGGHRHLRRPLRRPPVDPHRRRAGQEGEPVRHHDRPRQPDAVDDRRLPARPDRLERLQARRQLRLEQGPLPRAGPAGAAYARTPRWSRSKTSAAAGGRSSPASRSRSRAPTSPAASPTRSAARCPSSHSTRG